MLSELQELSQSVTVQNLNSKNYGANNKLAPRTTGEAIERGQPISVVQKITGIQAIEAQIEFDLIAAMSVLNLNLTLKDYQFQVIARELVAAFPNESIEDFQLCFRRGCLGAYGTIYNVDLSVISNWMREYLEEKYQLIENKNYNQIKQEKDVDYEAFKVRLEHERELMNESESDRLKAERERQLKDLKLDEVKQGYTPPNEDYLNDYNERLKQNRIKAFKAKNPEATEKQIQEWLNTLTPSI